MPNCEKCLYRKLIIESGGYVMGENCDQYETDLCKKMNDPEFIRWLDERNKNRRAEDGE